MPAESKGSVSHWLDGVKHGNSTACQALWNRYFASLVRIAEAKLQMIGRRDDGEDIALSALNSVMLGIRDDRYPQLADSTNLWPLLVTITARKAISQIRHQMARKRAGASQVPLAEVEKFIGDKATPDFANQVLDQLEHLVKSLGDPTLAIIAQRKLEGATHEEVAQELGCSPKTIVRKLNRIRQEWNAIAGLAD